MNVEVTKLPESRVALRIELTPSEVDQALERTYKQLVQRFNIPGFRRGKAPRSVVERLIGHEYFVREATEEAVRWGYNRAIKQERITPLDQAEIKGDDEDDHNHLEAGEAFHFEATVAVKPGVQLPDYRGMQVERQQQEVAGEDVDRLLHELQERNVTLEPVVRPAQVGDVVTMNITARAGLEEIIQQDSADYEVLDEESTPDQVLPGMSRALAGANRGEIKEFVVELPDAYPANPELSGATLDVRILLKEIKRKVLPELDDDFAQSISDLTTLDELRERLQENLEIERRIEADERLVNEAVDQVADRTFVEIPPVLIEDAIDRMVQEMRRSFEEAQLNFDTYLESGGRSESELRGQMRETATRNVKTSLVVGAIADAENVEVANDEVNATLEEVLRSVNVDAAERKRLRSSTVVRGNIRSRLRRQRALQKLVHIMSGGEEVSTEATDTMADQTADTAETEESVAVEVAG
ncbi:MAG: trigger factor [Chloroflexota bacterium]